MIQNLPPYYGYYGYYRFYFNYILFKIIHGKIRQKIRINETNPRKERIQERDGWI